MHHKQTPSTVLNESFRTKPQFRRTYISGQGRSTNKILLCTPMLSTSHRCPRTTARAQSVRCKNCSSSVRVIPHILFLAAGGRILYVHLDSKSCVRRNFDFAVQVRETYSKRDGHATHWVRARRTAKHGHGKPMAEKNNYKRGARARRIVRKH